MNSENLRFHAAGHLAAAHALALGGHDEAVKSVLSIVKQFVALPSISAPPMIDETLTKCIAQPNQSAAEIAMLEGWFCDPFNSTIEQAGGRF